MRPNKRRPKVANVLVLPDKEESDQALMEATATSKRVSGRVHFAIFEGSS